MPKAKKSQGLAYPPQGCNLNYDKFRSGWTFKEAYEHLAYRRDDNGRSFSPSKKRIIGEMAKLKREEYERYLEDCQSATKTECRRMCRLSKACGRTCVSKRLNCHKPADPAVCQVEAPREWTDAELDFGGEMLAGLSARKRRKKPGVPKRKKASR